MFSSSMIYTLLFSLGLFLLINSINVSAKDTTSESDNAKLTIEKRSAENNNDFDTEYANYLFSKHRFGARGIRLPSESILLGRRRLPDEAVLLGRRGLVNTDHLYNKRR